MPAHKKYHTEEERLAAKRANQERYRQAHREKLQAGRAKYREENRETLREKGRQYVAQNRDMVRARSAAWRIANPERAAEYGARWAKENPDLTCAKQHRRRARLLGSDPDLTAEEWREILEEFDNCCAYCQARGLKLEQEHITPLTRGGRHTKSNVVPSCRSCNARKNTKTLFEFAAMG
jgi:5-methylcytosine-specific restriction endonuclease McrA